MADAFTDPPALMTGAMKKAYRCALLCWAVPLVIGFVIFGLWLYSGRQESNFRILFAAGLVNIFFGTTCFVAGLLALLRFMLLGYCDTDYPRWHLWRRAVMAALLLVSNFGVAYGIVIYVSGSVLP